MPQSVFPAACHPSGLPRAKTRPHGDRRIGGARHDIFAGRDPGSGATATSSTIAAARSTDRMMNVSRMNGAATTVGVAAALAVCLAACDDKSESPLQGYIEGEYVRVAAPFGGALQQLTVKRGDQVALGASLFALEHDNETAARRQAEQQLQSANARLANLKYGKRPPEVATVEEQLRQATAARDLSAATVKRQEKLFASGFISSAALDDEIGRAHV